MTTTAEALAIAVERHRAGRLQEAESVYRGILEVEPNQVDALHLLGVIASQVGRHDVAELHIRRAIGIDPFDPGFHNNLGNALRGLGRLSEAADSYRLAIAYKVDFAEAYNNLGKTLEDQGALDEAIACHRRAIELKPDYAEGYNDLGKALGAKGSQEEPIECYRRALELKPDYAEAHNNLGTTYETYGQLNEAIVCYQRALEFKPDYPEAHNNLGIALRQLGRLDEALREHCRALELDPRNADGHFYQGMLRLLTGDFERGWSGFEWRWKTKQLLERHVSKHKWDGEPLGGRSILLHAEQGFGDTLQFVRYAAVVKRENPRATVVLECPRPLAKILGNCAGIDRLVAEGDELPPFDVHCPLLSLPGIFGTRPETIPAEAPYLFADEELVEKWGERLAMAGGQEKVDEGQEMAGQRPAPRERDQVWSRLRREFRIGINWQGRPGIGDFRKRDAPLEYFAKLAEISGVRLVSLQKGADRAELAKAGIWDPGDAWDALNGAFMDTAAIMKNVDLVISSDTAVPHLGGALGVPVWVALPFVPDWRWLLDRSDSPWYPTMRLFRQERAGDWAGVFEEIGAALRELGDLR